MMKKTISLLLALVMALCLVSPAAAADTAITGGVAEIQKYGNLVLDIAPEKLREAGFEYGDMLAVTVNGTGYDVPLCTNYSDVDNGALVLRDSGGVLILAVNMGDFATANGIAVKKTAEDKSYTWEFPEGKSLADVTVSIRMGEKGGYRDQYLIHQLTRTNVREDYSSDAVFANFRNVAVGGLGKNALFRSSSPVNNELGRAAFADALAKENGIRAVMDLADSDSAIKGFIASEDFASPYYQSLYEDGKVVALNLGIDFASPELRKGIVEGIRFFIANKGPYLVHCTEGKDRAGLVSAMLECLMGATYDEVAADYMTTYENYYHLTPDSEQYRAVKASSFAAVLTAVTGVEKGTDLAKLDLAAEVTGMLRRSGLTDDEIDALKANLSTDYTAAPAEPEPPAGSEVPAPSAAPAAGGGTYTVVRGDSLWKIAKGTLGKGSLWRRIYDLNRDTIRDPNMIFVGQVLVLPAA